MNGNLRFLLNVQVYYRNDSNKSKEFFDSKKIPVESVQAIGHIVLYFLTACTVTVCTEDDVSLFNSSFISIKYAYGNIMS